MNIQPKSEFRSILTLIAILSLLGGCRPTHNQSVIPAEWSSFFNSAPVNNNYLKTNDKHKVLVAVIDSGVDYNHPLLKNSIHYSIDTKGIANGAGWDFIGNDSWPLPYLARTRHLYQHDRRTLNEENLVATNIKNLLATSPELARWIHANRNLEDEAVQGIYHGTHVAGLASYDEPRIGIVPYRILPDQEDINGKSHDMVDVFFNYLEASIHHAAKQGARVINMSLGTSFGATENGSAHLIELFKKFEKLVNSYPNMIFVAAAGNENTWVNGETRFSFPCGIKASNLICVASINKSGSPSEFTNIPLVESPLVFAPGEKILAPIPSQYCNSKSLSDLSSNLDHSDIERLGKKLLKECPVSDLAPIMPLSGTSMASPIIARAVAIEALNFDSNIPASQIIESFLSHSLKTQVGPLAIMKFKIPVPSWYPKDSETQGLGLTESSLSRGYFEFYHR